MAHGARISLLEEEKGDVAEDEAIEGAFLRSDIRKGGHAHSFVCRGCRIPKMHVKLG